MSLKFCSLSSGSSGNCYLVGSDQTFLLIDAGISCKKIVDSLTYLNIAPEMLSGVLITHEHIDHIKGAELLSRKYGIPLFTNEKTGEEFLKLVKKTDQLSLNFFQNLRPFFLGDIEVLPYPVCHDAIDAVGFSLYCEKTQISIATDTGCITKHMIKELSAADLLVLEANHDVDMLKMGKYPWFLKQRILGQQGHLSNEDAGLAIARLFAYHPKQRQILLAHLSRENNFPEMALETVKNVLEEHHVLLNSGLQLNLLRRDELSPVYIL